MGDENDSGLLHSLDQMGAHLENIAELMSIYYAALIEKGVSDELAQKLVLDYSNQLWAGINAQKRR